MSMQNFPKEYHGITFFFFNHKAANPKNTAVMWIFRGDGRNEGLVQLEGKQVSGPRSFIFKDKCLPEGFEIRPNFKAM